MIHEEIQAWFDRYRDELVYRFALAGRQSELFPGFAALTRSQLQEVMEREVLGLESHLCADRVRLQQVTDTHKRQAHEITDHIPVEEQMRFLDHRLEILSRLLDSDPDFAGIREQFLHLVEAAKRYYKGTVRAIVFDQRFGQLAGA